MGRPIDAAYLVLALPDSTPLREDEFQLINELEFSVPFGDIRLFERTKFVIPGLKTSEDAVKDKFLAQKNLMPVNVQFVNGDIVSERCFTLSGRTSIEEVAAKVHNNFELDANSVLEFFHDEKMLTYGNLNCEVYYSLSNTILILNIYRNLSCRETDNGCSEGVPLLTVSFLSVLMLMLSQRTDQLQQ